MKKIVSFILLVALTAFALSAFAYTETETLHIYDLSEDEVDLLARLVAAEAASQPHAGKVAVANVVFNRLRDGRWGDFLNAVVYSPKQFAKPWKPGYKELTPEVYENCKNAVMAAMNGEKAVPDYVKYFRKTKHWKRGKPIARIGCHTFYVTKREAKAGIMDD